MIGVFNSIDHTVPTNAGSFRRIERAAARGLRGRHSAPSHELLGGDHQPRRPRHQRRAAGVRRDSATAIGLAEGGPCIPPSAAVISGIDPRSRRRRSSTRSSSPAAGGAGPPQRDGWLTICHVGNAGMRYIDSVELDEIHHPILGQRRRIIADSEGAGRFRGAPGARIEYGPVGGDIEVGYIADGTIKTAQGAAGGLRGAPGPASGAAARRQLRGARRVRRSGSRRANASSRSTPAAAGSARRSSAVEKGQRDVAEGWITAARARDVYGVVLDGDGHVDTAATAARRRTMAARSGLA